MDTVELKWDTVKDILKSELGRKYSRPELKGLRYIGIDEFTVAKGHIYMTIATVSSHGTTSRYPTENLKASTTRSRP